MFGMSLFQSVLERLKAEQQGDACDEDVGVQVFRHGKAGFSPGFIVDTSSAAATAFDAVERAYRELAPAEKAQPPVMPDYLRRTSLADVAADLVLQEQETAATLAAKRRRFAAANHPDRLPAEFRANATIRMKLANMLIDEASRRLPRDNRST
ncbi:hypothetical protein [Sinorhizobium mexicanum]|uniref:Uncharacterized protein n=1 Tax=Sinorhizobium mexicanum TaxID=375549 RepID=A0A859QK69_9HYPH|nr:hypothetical protein [Sinorhizobium mexicanum]MBP1883593.1 hypothetical protein [Sinorhizobium mexicanum]QLL62780.1 hypothetical protein FKV68_15675 [Sinorhizobium mexicanum]